MNTEIDDIYRAARIRQEFVDEIGSTTPGFGRRILENTFASGEIVPQRLEYETRERRVSLPAWEKVSLGYCSNGAGDNCWSVQSMRVRSSIESFKLIAGFQDILRLDSVGAEMFADETGSVELMQFLKHYTTLAIADLVAFAWKDSEIIITECRAPDNTDCLPHHWRTLAVEHQFTTICDRDDDNLSVPIFGGVLVDTMNIAFVPRNGGGGGGVSWFPAQVESFTLFTADHCRFTLPAWVCERTTEHAGATYFRIPLAGKRNIVVAVDIKFAESQQSAILSGMEVHVVNTLHNGMCIRNGLCGYMLAL